MLAFVEKWDVESVCVCVRGWGGDNSSQASHFPWIQVDKLHMRTACWRDLASVIESVSWAVQREPALAALWILKLLCSWVDGGGSRGNSEMKAWE